MANQVVHFELPFDNMERAQEFYRDAFGWAMSSMPGADYVTVSSDPEGNIIGFWQNAVPA